MLEVKNLSKTFGNIKAVTNVSFKAEKGEIVGFLGPNGAGKSTTMRMITGFLPPSNGSAIINGFDICEDPIKAKKIMGYLPENAPVYTDMTVYDFLDFCAQIRGFAGNKKKLRLEEIIKICFLTQVKHQSVSTLSKGFKQRVCFAQSIIHDPDYLIFDEPTDGLDPNQKHEVRLMIKQMSEKKVIILSTHILDEVDAVCSRAIVIVNGHIKADETPMDLRKKSPKHGCLLAEVTASDFNEKILPELKNIENVKSVETLFIEEAEVKIRIYPSAKDIDFMQHIIAFFKESNCQIKSINFEQGKLDEVFRLITSENNKN